MARNETMEVGVFEGRNRFSELVEAAERGEEVVVLKRGKPVAKLVPKAYDARASARRMKALEAADALRATYAGPVGGAAETRADRDRGRRF